MKDISRRVSDVALAVIAVIVLVSAFFVATNDSGTVSPEAIESLSSDATASPTPSATAPTTAPTSRPSPSPGQAADLVLIAGPDLAKMQRLLTAATSDTVAVAPSTAVEVLAPKALDAVTGTPSVVVLQVMAGSKTTMRAATAITAVQRKWPEAAIVVVGPFSSGDRKSAASAKAAATAAKVTFVDPVELGWRTNDATAVLSADDLQTVATRLADAITA